MKHNHEYGTQGKYVDMPEKIRTDYSDGPDKIGNPQQGIQLFEHENGVGTLPAEKEVEQDQRFCHETDGVSGDGPFFCFSGINGAKEAYCR